MMNAANFTGRPRLGRLARGLLALLALAQLAGCSYTGGQLLLFSGLFQGARIKAKVTLTKEPILVLVDDPAERVDWPIAKRLLEDDVAQALLKNKAAAKIVPPETLQRLRQSNPDIDERGCREVGRLAGAREVLWLEVQDFYIADNIEQLQEAAYFVVSVRVIDTQESDRARVRRWPESSRGEMVVATRSASQVAKVQSDKNKVAKDLTVDLADKIAKLFYDHRAEDFEKSPS